MKLLFKSFKQKIAIDGVGKAAKNGPMFLEEIRPITNVPQIPSVMFGLK